MGLLDNFKQNAAAFWGELQRAPQDLKGLLSPEFSAQVQAQMKQPANVDANRMAEQALDYLRTTNPVGGLFGIIKDIPAPYWLHGRTSVPVGINPTKSELSELFREEFKNTRHNDLRVLQHNAGGDLYAWPASDSLHQDIGAYFNLSPQDYKHLQWSKD